MLTNVVILVTTATNMFDSAWCMNFVEVEIDVAKITEERLKFLSSTIT